MPNCNDYIHLDIVTLGQSGGLQIKLISVFPGEDIHISFNSMLVIGT